MMCMNFSDIAILNIKRADYHCIVRGISKNETVNLMQNAKMTEKKELYKTQNLLLHVKAGKEILTFRDIEADVTNFIPVKVLLFKDVDIEKVLVLTRFFLEKKAISTLLFLLNHYM